MDAIISEIKEKTDVIELIGRYMQLKKAGRHFTGLCPFHKEKSPSFVVSPDRQMWYCFGACHEGGDVISFVMKYENIPFYEALQELAQLAGVSLQNAKIVDRDWDKREVLYKINELANKYYQHILHNTKFGEKAVEYLRARGLNDKIVKTFEIGYAPEAWENLHKFLLKKGFKQEDILRTGLLVQNDRGSVYDRFRGRIMFPIKDVRSNIIAFSGRILTGDKEAKYINTPETELYKKRESLYGIHLTKDAIREQKKVLVVEGEFDVIGPFEFGIDPVVAIKGSSITRDHLRILKRYAQKIILCLDNDAAGQDAVSKTITDAESMDIEIYVMTVPDGKDPDDAVRTNLLHFKDAIEKAVPAVDYLLQNLREKADIKNPFDKKRALEKLVAFIALLSNPILVSHYLKKAAGLFETDEDSIRSLLNLHIRKKQTGFRRQITASISESKEEQLPTNEKYLMQVLLQSETINELLPVVFANIESTDFTHPALQKIAKALQKLTAEKRPFESNIFADALPKELIPTFDEVSLQLLPAEQIAQEDLERMALQLKQKVIKKQIEEAVKRPEAQENDDFVGKLYANLRSITFTLEKKSGKR